MTITVLRRAITSVLALSFTALPAQPDTAIIAEAQNWRSATHYRQDGTVACYARTSHFGSHLEVYYNPHRRKIQVNVIPNFTLDPAKQSQLQIGNKVFTLPNWTDTPSDGVGLVTQGELLDAIRRGRHATFHSTMAAGTSISITFSLMGSTAMTNDAARRCGFAPRQPRRATQTVNQNAQQPSNPSPGCTPGFDQETGMAIIEESIANDDIFGVLAGAVMAGNTDC